MSRQDDKLKKSTRRHKKYVKAKKQMDNWKDSISNWTKQNLTVTEPKSINVFSKKHALSCHVPMCPLCGNKRRVTGEKTIQEKKHEQKDKFDN